MFTHSMTFDLGEDVNALRDMVLGAFESAGHETPSEMPIATYVGGALDGDDDGSEVQWILGLEGEASAAPDFWPVTLAAMVLGGGMSSRLFQALREFRLRLRHLRIPLVVLRLLAFRDPSCDPA